MRLSSLVLSLALLLVAVPLAPDAQQAAKRYRIAFVGIAPRTAAEVAEGPPYKGVRRRAAATWLRRGAERGR